MQICKFRSTRDCCSFTVSTWKSGVDITNDCIDVYEELIVFQASSTLKWIWEDVEDKFLRVCCNVGIKLNLSKACKIFDNNLQSEVDSEDRSLRNKFNVGNWDTA